MWKHISQERRQRHPLARIHTQCNVTWVCQPDQCLQNVTWVCQPDQSVCRTLCHAAGPTWPKNRHPHFPTPSMSWNSRSHGDSSPGSSRRPRRRSCNTSHWDRTYTEHIRSHRLLRTDHAGIIIIIIIIIVSQVIRQTGSKF